MWCRNRRIRIMNAAAVPTAAGNDAHENESSARARHSCVPPASATYTHPALHLLKRNSSLSTHSSSSLPLVSARPSSPRVDGGVYIFELAAALASKGAGWALSRACLLPLGLSSLSRSPVAGPGPEHRRVLRRRRHLGGPQILLPPSSFFGSGPVRSHSSHAFGGVWGLWKIFFPFHHSHRSRRQAQKEKRVHLNAGPARRSARRNPSRDLWCMNMCVRAYGRGGWMRMGMQGGWKGKTG